MRPRQPPPSITLIPCRSWLVPSPSATRRRLRRRCERVRAT